MSLFTKAKKADLKLRMALIGPSGAGKTYSALLIARGLVGPTGRIAVIDTENGTANLYVNRPGIGEFDIAEISAPFHIKKYLEALGAAKDYDCVIIDSLSHAWSGAGGILQQKEELDARGGNSFTNWGKMTPEQNSLVNAVLHTKTHLIATMRSKTEYVMTENDRGKTAPKKVGMAPIQRDGFEYEFDICLDMAMNNTAQASKDRSSLFPQTNVFKPSNDTGKQIADWLKGPVREEKKPTASAADVSTADATKKTTTPSEGTSKKRSIDELAHYVMPFGKFSGQQLMDIDYDALSSYADYIALSIARDKKAGKFIRPQSQEVMDVMDEWLSAEGGSNDARRETSKPGTKGGSPGNKGYEKEEDIPF